MPSRALARKFAAIIIVNGGGFYEEPSMTIMDTKGWQRMEARMTKQHRVPNRTTALAILELRAATIARKLHSGAWQRFDEWNENPDTWPEPSGRSITATWERLLSETLQVLVADYDLRND